MWRRSAAWITLAERMNGKPRGWWSPISAASPSTNICEMSVARLSRSYSFAAKISCTLKAGTRQRNYKRLRASTRRFAPVRVTDAWETAMGGCAIVGPPLNFAKTQVRNAVYTQSAWCWSLTNKRRLTIMAHRLRL